MLRVEPDRICLHALCFNQAIKIIPCQKAAHNRFGALGVANSVGSATHLPWRAVPGEIIENLEIFSQ